MGSSGNWKIHKYLACRDALSTQGGCFDAYMYSHMNSVQGLKWLNFSHCFHPVTNSQYWNIDSWTKRILVPAAVTVAVVKTLVVRKSYSQTHHKCWLVFPCAEQVWQNIVDARVMLCCLGAQQVKTPQCHSSRLFSCYMHILTHRELWCNRHSVSLQVSHHV